MSPSPNRESLFSASTFIDATGLFCPLPIVMLKKAIDKLNPGGRVQIWADNASFGDDVISWVSVDGQGLINPDEVKQLIHPDTIFISLTMAFNEIGTLEPICKLGKMAKERKILLPLDGVAAAGLIPINVNDYCIDLLSLSGNNFYVPLGTGALCLHQGIWLQPLTAGGTQENGLRAGSHNLSGIAGIVVAADLDKEELLSRRNT